MAETNVEDEELCSYVCTGVHSSITTAYECVHSSIMTAHESGGPSKLIRNLWVPESYCSAEFSHLHIFVTLSPHLGNMSKLGIFFWEGCGDCSII